VKELKDSISLVDKVLPSMDFAYVHKGLTRYILIYIYIYIHIYIGDSENHFENHKYALIHSYFPFDQVTWALIPSVTTRLETDLFLAQQKPKLKPVTRWVIGLK